MRVLVAVAAVLACACGSASQAGGVAEYGYEIVHTYPHDRHAFTEGLFYLDGFLYESTGLNGQSSVRKVRLETGEVIEKYDIPEQYFGEGIVKWKDHIVGLTYRSQKGFIYDFATLQPKSEFAYPGEGWALTHDGRRIIMDDGTAELRFWDPDTLQETGRLKVTDQGAPVTNLNELEWVKGEIFANIWTTNRIARINPTSGNVVGWIDLTGILSPSDQSEGVDVLNGIAYDSQHDRLFVTGKNWPKLFEIRLVKKTSTP